MITTFILIYLYVSTPACGTGHAAIAQLVERLTSNQEVSSSNLGGGFDSFLTNIFIFTDFIGRKRMFL